MLRLEALYIEPGVNGDDELIASLAFTMRDFMQFHHARDLVIEKSNPDWFATKLARAI